MTDIREILRRVQLGERARRIARDLAISRNTVAHYERWATRHGLLPAPLPEPVALAAMLAAPPEKRPAQEQSGCPGDSSPFGVAPQEGEDEVGDRPIVRTRGRGMFRVI